MGKVDSDSPRPPYQQVADSLRSSIAGGTFKPGERLPKQPELATEYSVAVGTVKAALRVLRDEGLIVSRQGEGSWVHSQPADSEEPGVIDGHSPPNEPELRHMLAEIRDRLTTIERLLTEKSE